MFYALRDDVSFCVVEGKSIFLDIDRDRYFGLGPDAELAFQRLIANVPLFASDRLELEKLRSKGILAGHGNDLPPPQPMRARKLAASIWENAEPGMTLRSAPSLTISLLQTELWLRKRPLKDAIEVVTRLRNRVIVRPDECDDGLTECVRAFASSAFLFSTHNQCLWRSIALASFLARMGLTAELVFGVRLRPFAAHCWVQRQDQLLNDSLDRVANFTPIRVI